MFKQGIALTVSEALGCRYLVDVNGFSDMSYFWIYSTYTDFELPSYQSS